MTYKKTPMFDDCGLKFESESRQDPAIVASSEVTSEFKKSSLIFFRGFSATTQLFRQFSSAFGVEHGNYAGGSHGRVKVDGNSDILAAPKMTVGGDAIPAHAEMTYVKNFPKIIWFHCGQPSKSGGQTTIYDGCKIWKNLSSETQKLLQRKKLKYSARYPESQWPEIFQDPSVAGITEICKRNGVNLVIAGTIPGSLIAFTEYTCSALSLHGQNDEPAFMNHILPSLWQEKKGRDFVRVRFEDNTPIPDDVGLELFEVCESLVHEIHWLKGDFVMIDNTRFMHGRRAFFGSREINLRMCMTPIPELGLTKLRAAS